MNCHACGTSLSAGARFCHKCGAKVGIPEQAGWKAGLPWGIAGLALGALLVVVLMRVGGDGSGAPPAPPAGATSGMTDISQMSVEEMASRLFDRVMRLQEEGKTDSVAFFAPMALQTYGRLPALDHDARFDIGQLQLAAGNAAGALAQADTILRAVPTHLYAFMLRGLAYKTQGNAQALRQAYRAFLANEAAERVRNRPEYGAHMNSIDAFHTEALQATGAP